MLQMTWDCWDCGMGDIRTAGSGTNTIRFNDLLAIELVVMKTCVSSD